MESNRAAPEWGRAIFSPLCVLLRPTDDQQARRGRRRLGGACRLTPWVGGAPARLLCSADVHFRQCRSKQVAQFLKYAIALTKMHVQASAARGSQPPALPGARRRPGAGARQQPGSRHPFARCALVPPERPLHTRTQHRSPSARQVAKIVHPVTTSPGAKRRVQAIHAAHQRYCDKQVGASGAGLHRLCAALSSACRSATVTSRRGGTGRRLGAGRC